MFVGMWPDVRSRLPAWWPRVETRPGDVLAAGGLLVTPIARTVSIDAKVGGGVFVRLGRPVAVSVVKGGKQSRVRIVDVTRLMQGLIVLVAVLPVCWVCMRKRTRKER